MSNRDQSAFLTDAEWRRQKGIEAIRIDYAEEQHDDSAVTAAIIVAALLVTAAIALLRGGGL